MNMLTKNYRNSLLESLQDPAEAAAYLDAAIEDEDSRVFLLALRDVAASARHKPCGGGGGSEPGELITDAFGRR